MTSTLTAKKMTVFLFYTKKKSCWIKDICEHQDIGLQTCELVLNHLSIFYKDLWLFLLIKDLRP